MMPAPQELRGLIDNVGFGLELVGIGIIVLGAIASTYLVWRKRRECRDFTDAVERYRSLLGRSILLGIELLVAADIIATVATRPSFTSLGTLAIIILIRTFLSLSLGVEIEGRFPWQRDRKPERSAAD